MLALMKLLIGHNFIVATDFIDKTVLILTLQSTSHLLIVGLAADGIVLCSRLRQLLHVLV